MLMAQCRRRGDGSESFIYLNPTMRPDFDLLDSLRDEMNAAWERKEEIKRELDQAWDEAERLQSRHGARIDSLKDEHDRVFEAMGRAFSEAESAYSGGDHGAARDRADDGKSYKSQLPGLVSERRSLIDEVRAARARHGSIVERYRDVKRDFDLAREQFNDQLAVVRAARMDAIFAAGVQHYGHEVLVKHEADGKTSVYFGGVDRPDGEGHAHYVLDEAGNITYRRDPFSSRGPQNFR